MWHEQHYNSFIKNNPYPRELHYYKKGTSQRSMQLQKNGKVVINFSSNDYLGLSEHPILIKRAQEFAKKYGVGSASSRLVTGNLSLYEKLEQQLANAMGRPAALILGTGFQTNFSVLDALLDPMVLGKEPLVLCDRLCHNSLLNGARYHARVQRFRHNDLGHLQQLLEKFSHQNYPTFILAESIYSMDGDQADLKRLITLANQYRAMLYIDDAHAIGVYGASGWGLAADYADDIDIIMGTLSKALGSMGGYIACSLTVRDYLINKCKGLIYSTGLSPMVLGAISAAIDILPSLNQERQIIKRHAETLRNFLTQENLAQCRGTTHIIPWIIGDANKTMQASALFEEYGIIAVAIRPPSVPPNQSRIRFCMSALHSDADLEHLMTAIKKVKKAVC